MGHRTQDLVHHAEDTFPVHIDDDEAVFPHHQRERPTRHCRMHRRPHQLLPLLSGAQEIIGALHVGELDAIVRHGAAEPRLPLLQGLSEHIRCAPRVLHHDEVRLVEIIRHDVCQCRVHAPNDDVDRGTDGPQRLIEVGEGISLNTAIEEHHVSELRPDHLLFPGLLTLRLVCRHAIRHHPAIPLGELGHRRIVHNRGSILGYVHRMLTEFPLPECTSESSRTDEAGPLASRTSPPPLSEVAPSGVQAIPELTIAIRPPKAAIEAIGPSLRLATGCGDALGDVGQGLVEAGDCVSLLPL
mmetsp:Transcript_32083/g.68370  ORF Transcript_32083/g.68370 Transcript_32083/m.68370 type:complete len:299 (+) Transcript_32083:347-1243(+)